MFNVFVCIPYGSILIPVPKKGAQWQYGDHTDDKMTFQTKFIRQNDTFPRYPNAVKYGLYISINEKKEVFNSNITNIETRERPGTWYRVEPLIRR